MLLPLTLAAVYHRRVGSLPRDRLRCCQVTLPRRFSLTDSHLPLAAPADLRRAALLPGTGGAERASLLRGSFGSLVAESFGSPITGFPSAPQSPWAFLPMLHWGPTLAETLPTLANSSAGRRNTAMLARCCHQPKDSICVLTPILRFRPPVGLLSVPSIDSRVHLRPYFCTSETGPERNGATCFGRLVPRPLLPEATGKRKKHLQRVIWVERRRRAE